MKKHAIVIMVFLRLTAFGQESNSSFGEEMASIMEHMKTYTISLAEQMPEEKYDYRPTDGMRSFREQTEHIAISLDFQVSIILSGKSITQEEFLPTYRSLKDKVVNKPKAELLAILEDRFDKAIEQFNIISDTELEATHSFEGWPPFYPKDQPVTTLRTISMGVRDHITHHRAQMIVYLRLNDIKPASYRLY